MKEGFSCLFLLFSCLCLEKERERKREREREREMYMYAYMDINNNLQTVKLYYIKIHSLQGLAAITDYYK